MKPALQLKIGQQLTLTPQLQQAIRLLQLSTLDLEQEIQSTLDSNPMLEVEESVREEIPLPNYSQPKSLNNDFNLIDIQSSPAPNLREHLLWQINLSYLSDCDKIIAAILIDHIDDDGFLTQSLDNLVDDCLRETQSELDSDDLESVLAFIQHCDPLGAGARDLRECLLLQCEPIDENTPYLKQAKLIINKYMGKLALREYKFLMRKCECTEEELTQVIQLIQSLNPRPGNQISPEKPSYITPDVIVNKINDRWQVSLNTEVAPHLKINNTYANLIQRADKSPDNIYMKERLQEARWFIKSLHSRNSTLMKVSEYIIQEQWGFLEHGDEAMKPMVLSDVATAVDMHESTISRVTTQKYMLTPRGVFELKYFFSSSVNTDSGGECSSTAIRAIIKKIVAAESPMKPLSDNKIAVLLKDKGINVARRTIAKYREAIHIPPSHERRRLA